MRDYLFNSDKIDYIRGKKPDVNCILCAISEASPEVESLEVYRFGTFIVSLNLYPFNPGHLMIFPRRHIADPAGLSDDEVLILHRLTLRSMDILKEEFNPSGFNMGYNVGRYSGASMEHLHAHIVPRYENELGFLDVISGTRVMVVDPRDAKKRLAEHFKSSVF